VITGEIMKSIFRQELRKVLEKNMATIFIKDGNLIVSYAEDNKRTEFQCWDGECSGATFEYSHFNILEKS